jgi:hypothetical protein
LVVVVHLAQVSAALAAAELLGAGLKLKLQMFALLVQAEPLAVIMELIHILADYLVRVELNLAMLLQVEAVEAQVHRRHLVQALLVLE